MAKRVGSDGSRPDNSGIFTISFEHTLSWLGLKTVAEYRDNAAGKKNYACSSQLGTKRCATYRH